MIQNLQDGKRALGLGVAFLAYAAFLLWDEYYKWSRIRRLNIARDNREVLIEQEMTVLDA